MTKLFDFIVVFFIYFIFLLFFYITCTDFNGKILLCQVFCFNQVDHFLRFIHCQNILSYSKTCYNIS
jgi:hypothetical protein